MPLFDLNQALIDPLKEEEGNQPEAILFGSGHHDRKANQCPEPPQQEETRAGKWMPSSTRLMRKMIDSTGETIRACSDCNTTKTPLWRSGPNGPKVFIFSINELACFCMYPKMIHGPRLILAVSVQCMRNTAKEGKASDGRRDPSSSCTANEL